MLCKIEFNSDFIYDINCVILPRVNNKNKIGFTSKNRANVASKKIGMITEYDKFVTIRNDSIM